MLNLIWNALTKERGVFDKLETYAFEPKEDITTKELATIISRSVLKTAYITPENYELKNESTFRHFRKI